MLDHTGLRHYIQPIESKITCHHKCTGVHTFGDAKNFCPNFILFVPNNV